MTYNPLIRLTVASRAGICALLTSCAMLLTTPGMANPGPVLSPDPKALANPLAQNGLALSALASAAPQSYSVQPGDSLWSISKLFLKSPWRWPELWGLNRNDIKNPHLIYPGQKLTLEKIDGQARLRSEPADPLQNQLETPPTVRLSPRTRIQSVPDTAVPTLKMHLIEPFLAEPVIMDENSLQTAARIVASHDGRVLLSRADRAYARGQDQSILRDELDKPLKTYRIFREASALTDPVSGEILGYEAHWVGQAQLMRSESAKPGTSGDARSAGELVPATIDILAAKQEIRIGDRLLPEPARQLAHYAPHAPTTKIDARIMSVYGNAVAYAGQNQVVTINRGSRDGVDQGQVLAILRDGRRLTDDAGVELKLPDERNGLMMVFRAFEKLSYGLILESTDVVRVGDRLVNPR